MILLCPPGNADAGPSLDRVQAARHRHHLDQEAGTIPPLPFDEQPCLLRPVLSGRSVDAVPQYLNHGEVSLHLVQSGKTHELRAMNARPRLASARASASFGSVASAITLPLMSASWTDGGPPAAIVSVGKELPPKRLI